MVHDIKSGAKLLPVERSKGKMKEYIKDLKMYVIWVFYVYKRKQRKKSALLPFLDLVTDFNKNISGTFDVPERVLP